MSTSSGVLTFLKSGEFMKNKKFIFFDLDGTLTDPGVGITNSVMHALKYYNIEVESRESLYPFIGPPLVDSFMKYYGFSRAQGLEAVEHYREYYRDRGVFEASVYDGIPELLSSLKAAGKTLIVASSKPEEFVIQVLERFDLYKYFDCVAGATMDSGRVKKDDVIAYAMEKFNVTDPTGVVMIGDREFDVLGGKAFGMKTIGVTFGYGSLEELTNAGADITVDSAQELLAILL